MGPEVLLTLEIGFAAVFGWAGTTKLLDPRPFYETLGATGLRPRLAQRTTTVLALFEIGISLAVVTPVPIVTELAFATASALLMLFIGWLSFILLRGIRTACNCFGRNGKDVRLLTLVRTAVLTGGAVSAFALSRRTASPLEPSLAAVMTVTCLFLAAIAAMTLVRVAPRLVLTDARLFDASEPSEEA